MATPFTGTVWTITDASGNPVSGAKIYTYAAGTLTAKAAYTTSAFTTATSNPVICSTSGRATFFFGPGAYRVRVFDANNVELPEYEEDNLTSGEEVSVNLASTAIGFGASLVGWLRAATAAVASTVQNRLSWLPFNAFEFMTVAEIADTQAYTFGLNLTVPLQAAMNAAYAAKRELYCPAGGYLVTGLQIPGTNDNAGKASRFRIHGDGFGEAGVIALKNRGTVLYSVTNAPILNYTQTVSGGQGSGEVEIDNLAIWGTSTTPVVLLDTFFGLSHIHHCNIVQIGTGNGLQINFGATYDIHHNYIIGASYAAIDLGAARTGVGIYLAQAGRSAGLQTIRQCTSAGWSTAFQLGVIGGAAYLYQPVIDKCESAYCFTGIHLTGQCEGALVSGCYFEGQDAGQCLLDDGNYNRVKDCFFFFSSGSLSAYTMLKSTTAAKFGSRYEGNIFYLFNEPNTVGLDIASNGTDGGPAKVASRNHFVHSNGTAGNIGLRIAGVDPRIEVTSNDFQPAASWTGAGSLKISNTSTSSDGTTGTAVFGLSQSQSLSGARTIPALGRGSLNVAVDPTVLNNTNVAAGVLTLGELSAFSFTPTGNVSITSFTAPNLPDKTFSIHVTATAFAVTFTNGALLKLAGSANLVTGANGCWITFQIKAGGVAWEQSRVVY
jgi:hypothetical protein